MPQYATFAEMHIGVRVGYMQKSYPITSASVFLSSAVLFMLEPLAKVTQPCFLVWSHLYRFQFGETEELMLAFISVFQLSRSSIY